MLLALTVVVVVVYYQRLAVHKLLAREVIVSLFLPWGTRAYGEMGEPWR